MNNKKGSVIWGLIIIIVGVIFLGNTLGIWNVSIFFDGWWTLFIIIPSFIGMIKEKTYVTSFLAISIGILMLCACQDIIKWSLVGKLFIPILLITIGLTIIFKPSVKRIKHKETGKDEYIGVFSETIEKITGEFSDCSLVAVFGGIELDLREAKIKEDIVIDAVSIFGGIDIKVPNNVNVKTSGVPIFGGMDNKCSKEDNDKKVTININYVSIFSGIDVK